MILRVYITKNVLNRSQHCGSDGQKDKTQHCAIAVAIKTLWPKSFVGLHEICSHDSSFKRIPLPENAKLFINEFDAATPDQRQAMQPFAFDIEVTEAQLPQWWAAAVSEAETLELVEA